MESLMQKLADAGVTVTRAYVQEYLSEVGLGEESLNSVVIDDIVSTLKRRVKGGGLAKATKPAGMSRRGRKQVEAPTQESVQVETPGQQMADVFAGVNAGHRAIVEGLVDQTQQQAQSDAAEIVQALYGMTPLTLQLAAEGLGAGLAAGHFDPERFRQLGASLVTQAGIDSRDLQAS